MEPRFPPIAGTRAAHHAGPPAPPATPPRSTGGAAARARAALRATGTFFRAVFEKASEDNIFFLAGAISFNIIVAIVPLILAVLGIAGTILRTQHADPSLFLEEYLFNALPPVSQQFRDWTREILDSVLGQSTSLLSIGTIFLIWIATRLVGTLRTALREVFDIQQDRGIIAGKLFDIRMVIAAGTLFALNVGSTVLLEVIGSYGVEAFGLRRFPLPSARFYGQTVAFLTIWAMFLLVYRYLPARRISWSTALVAATFTGVLFEVMKLAFSWYVTHAANYRSTYGNLTTLIILFFWIYYTSVLFILGGEVAQVVAMQRIRRHQRERLQ